MSIVKNITVAKMHNTYSSLPLGAVTARGWLREQLLRSKDGMGGHMDELEPELIGTPWLEYPTMSKHPIYGDMTPDFAAGLCGELSGCYWTGLVQLAFTLQDEELIAKATRWVDGVLKTQEPDGYLGTFAPDRDRMLDYNPWSAAWGYRALLSFYEANRRKDVLDAVHRGLLWFCEHWKNHKTDYSGPFLIEPMIVAYAYTGDERLVTFCEDYLLWLENNSIWPNKVSQYLSEKLSYASAHAVSYGELVKNPATVYCANGQEQLLRASVKGMEKGLKKIIQTTGGASSCGEQLSPKGAANETEYCNFSTYNHTYSWLALVTGEARWGDELERCLFNGAQGARKKDERAIAYFTAPNQLRATRTSSVYGAQTECAAYTPCYPVACCTANSVRIIPEFVRSMGMVDEQDDLYLLCYGPAEIRAPKLDLAMDTLYPFRDRITLHVTRSDGGMLYLRVPAWCKTPKATVNGNEVSLPDSGSGFVRVDAALAEGDAIELQFPMEIKIYKVDDSDSVSRYPLCVERGPLVYALPIPTLWEAYGGNPVTPLPDGWSWYEAQPDAEHPDFKKTFMKHDIFARPLVMDEDLDPNQIRVEEHDGGGYVWEEPPVTLTVPLYATKGERMFFASRLIEPWEAVQEAEGDPVMCTLVPHGCTNLRITYFSRLAKNSGNDDE